MQIEAGKYYRTRDGRKVGPMEASRGPWPLRGYIEGVSTAAFEKNGYCPHYGQYDLVAEWIDPTPAIVAVIRNGKPSPAVRPVVHPSAEAATAEARRLARQNPGQEFAVFQRVAGVVAEVTLKDVA